MTNAHSSEKTTIALVSGEGAANPAWPALWRTFISDDGSGRRAFPIEIEVQRMSCPRCQHTFPVGFYCIKYGYVPTGRKTDDRGMFVMSERRIEQDQINWIRQQNKWRQTTD